MLPSDSEGDLSIPKLPSDSEGDLSIPTLSQHDVTTGSLQLPSDESADSLFDVGLSSDASDGDEDCDTKKQRRRFTIKPGCSRESMMEDGPQISSLGCSMNQSLDGSMELCRMTLLKSFPRLELCKKCGSWI